MFDNRPTPREMSDQIRRLYRERDNVILQAVCQSVGLAIYDAERREKALGIVRTDSGNWAMALNSHTAILAPIAGSSNPTRIMEKSYA